LHNRAILSKNSIDKKKEEEEEVKTHLVFNIVSLVPLQNKMLA